MVLAVYHTSKDVEAHLTALRRAGRFKLTCHPQGRNGLVGRLGRTVDGVLWELSPGAKPDRQRLTRIAQFVPVVSYSSQATREVADLSRSIGFVSHLKAPLSPVDVEHRIAFSARVDFATRLARSENTLRRYLRRVDVLDGVVRAVNASLDPARVAEVVVARATDWVPGPSHVVVVLPELGEAQILASRGLTPSLSASVNAVARWVTQHRQTFGAANLAQDARVPGGAPVSVLALPLECRGRTIGALIALDRRLSRQPPRLAPATVEALNLVLTPAAIALDSAIRVQHAEALSVTDDLTQLYNSRYLSEALRREAKRSVRSGRAVSLLFIDLDGFKSINDAHGHLYGSRALVEAAAVIKGCARETDIVARFGGDEFAVVLPDTDSEGAVAVGDRVRDRIAQHSFLAGEGLDICLTASVGVGTLPGAATSAEGLIAAADLAMYWVKDQGKNGIHVASA